MGHPQIHISSAFLCVLLVFTALTKSEHNFNSACQAIGAKENDRIIDIRASGGVKGVVVRKLRTTRVFGNTPDEKLRECIDECCHNDKCTSASVLTWKTKNTETNCELLQCEPIDRCVWIKSKGHLSSRVVRAPLHEARLPASHQQRVHTNASPRATPSARRIRTTSRTPRKRITYRTLAPKPSKPRSTRATIKYRPKPKMRPTTKATIKRRPKPTMRPTTRATIKHWPKPTMRQTDVPPVTKWKAYISTLLKTPSASAKAIATTVKPKERPTPSPTTKRTTHQPRDTPTPKPKRKPTTTQRARTTTPRKPPHTQSPTPRNTPSSTLRGKELKSTPVATKGVIQRRRTSPATPTKPERNAPKVSSHNEQTQGVGSGGQITGPADLLKNKTVEYRNMDIQDEHVQVTYNPKVALIAALLFGSLFTLSVVILVVKRVYESWQRRHYRKVDYLIEGMYA